jgi:hypothetical protein
MYTIFANAGLPMIGVQMHLMIVALAPIIAIETVVIRQKLGLSVSRSLEGSVLANIVSTFVGIPLTWVALLAIQMATGGGRGWGLETPLQKLAAVTVQAPLLMPYERALYWMMPVASLVLLLPSLAVSVIIEAWILAKLFPNAPRKSVWGTMWVANLLSYALLVAYTAVQLYQILSNSPSSPRG